MVGNEWLRQEGARRKKIFGWSRIGMDGLELVEMRNVQWLELGKMWA